MRSSLSSHGWSRALLDTQSAVAAAGGDSQSIMEAVVAGALGVIPQANGASVEMRDTDEGECRAASGVVRGYIGYRQPLSGSLFEQSIASGKAEICADTEVSMMVDRAACRELGIGTIMIVPLPFEGRVIGTLKIFAGQPGVFDDSDLLKAQLLAGPITTGLAAMARKRADRQRIADSRRFEATFTQAAVGMAHVAPDGSFMLVNDCFCRIAGHSRASLLKDGFQRITHPDDLDADVANVGRLIAREIDHYAMEKRYIRADGGLVWVNLTVSLVCDDSGATGFFVAVIEDISARKHAERQASHDILTGLPNRRWLIDELGVHLAATSAAPLVVAYLDLDGFKGVNDRFGHQEGDRCLIDVAAALESGLHETDSICRIAGDEFVIVMPGATRHAAMKRMNRAKSAISALCQDRPWTIGVSVGAVAVDIADVASVEEVLTAADRLMYEAKRKQSATPKVRYLRDLLAA